MKLQLGVKSDPIEYRYSYDWLFGLLQRAGIHHVQLGSFFELSHLEDGFFLDLREKAERAGIRISSVFTAHREVHGWFTGDAYMEKAARKIYERLIHAGALLGADYVGSSAGSVLRDRFDHKDRAIGKYFEHMKELMSQAKDEGLKGLTIEVMSCAAEPPTFSSEIDLFMEVLGGYHRAHADSTVQAYICGDTSHGYADETGRVQFSNYQMFLKCIPYMSEFHFKNTDSIFSSTFGFSEGECARGNVDLERIRGLIYENESRWPVDTVIGYLEHPGPKLGRDYTDCKLERMLTESIERIQEHFGGEQEPLTPRSALHCEIAACPAPGRGCPDR